MRRLPAALLAFLLAFGAVAGIRLDWDESPGATDYLVTCQSGQLGTEPVEEHTFVTSETYIRFDRLVMPPGWYVCKVQARNEHGLSGASETMIFRVRSCDVTGFRAVYTSSRTEWSEDGSVSTTHHLSRAVQGERRCE